RVVYGYRIPNFGYCLRISLLRFWIMSEVAEADISGLCGFSRCRAPLPGPGPRGGRPFAYCPDRSWPGGKTCKQLAAAQEALAEALGEASGVALSGATEAIN